MRPLHVRLAAWGTVLIAAALAATVRVGAATEVENGANGPQVNGRTSQGRPMWAVLEDGRVREIRMVWQVECDDGSRIAPFGLTARDSVDSFKQRGAGFTFAESRDFDEGRGWTSTVRSRIQGDATRGTASVEISFRQGRVDDGFTCRSGRIRWALGGGV